jgi:hypothetical protein
MVALRTARLRNGFLRASRWALVLTLCLAIGLLLAMPGTAWGISGYASGQTAVAAQYPDSAAAKSNVPNAPSDLAEVILATRSAQRRDPAQWQAAQQSVVRREIEALSTGAGPALGQTGSIALLIAALAVVLVGGVLRWQRGHAQTE